MQLYITCVYHTEESTLLQEIIFLHPYFSFLYPFVGRCVFFTKSYASVSKMFHGWIYLFLVSLLLLQNFVKVSEWNRFMFHSSNMESWLLTGTHLTTLKPSVLHHSSQSCLLKSDLRTVILMTQTLFDFPPRTHLKLLYIKPCNYQNELGVKNCLLPVRHLVLISLRWLF